MFTATQKHIAVGFIIVLSIAMVDMLPDILHSLFWCLEIMFEWLELTIERILLHTFPITHHQSEIFTSYILLVMGITALYFVGRVSPRLYRQFKRNLRAAWLRQKRRSSYYWRHLPIMQKIKLVSLCTTGVAGLTFLI